MNKTKILIIDNDVEHCEANKRMLANAGYEVVVVHNGKEGLESVRMIEPDLIMLDAELPDINGFSVCRELKEDPELSAIPILILTALGASEESYLANMAKEHQANAFLTKPADTKKLLSTISELVTATPVPPSKPRVRAKILLIDDDPDFLDATRQILSANQFQVITAQNGEEGIAKAKYESPDLIVLDVIMPGKDGYSVCYELRKIAQTRPIPIIMLTAVGQQLSKPEYAMDMAIDHLADDFLDKPFDAQKLIKKIEKHLR